MLDQTTDRMWYMIGAILLGAAIIGAMLFFMPEAFASVGGMFDDFIGKVAIGETETLQEYLDRTYGSDTNIVYHEGIYEFITDPGYGWVDRADLDDMSDSEASQQFKESLVNDVKNDYEYVFQGYNYMGLTDDDYLAAANHLVDEIEGLPLSVKSEFDRGVVITRVVANNIGDEAFNNRMMSEHSLPDLDYTFANIWYIPVPLDFDFALNMSIQDYMYDTHGLHPWGRSEPSLFELDPIRVNGVDYNRYIDTDIPS